MKNKENLERMKKGFERKKEKENGRKVGQKIKINEEREG